MLQSQSDVHQNIIELFLIDCYITAIYSFKND